MHGLELKLRSLGFFLVLIASSYAYANQSDSVSAQSSQKTEAPINPLYSQIQKQDFLGVQLAQNLESKSNDEKTADFEKETTISKTNHTDSQLPSVRKRHWDSGLQVRYADFYGRPEIVPLAQWLKHWKTGFKLGPFLSSLIQPVKRKIDNETPRMHVYSAGLSTEFDLYGNDSDLPGIALGLNLGQGFIGKRLKIESNKKYEQVAFYLVEPYFQAHFFHWLRMEWGFGVAFRRIQAKDKTELENTDLNGAEAFLSFRRSL